jgi:ATP-dependent exoDNAse (exonuclease V) alpha subunit
VKGVGEVAGIPHEVLREFSRRRIQIEEAMTERGDTSIRSARRLAVQTRARKDHDVDPATLAIDWHKRAGLHGLDRAAVQDIVDPQRASQQSVVQRSTPVTDEALARMLTDQDATFDRRAVLRVVAEHAPAGARVGDLEAHTDRFLSSRHVEAVGVALTGVQYSTVELLAIEQHLLDNATSRRGDGVGMCDALLHSDSLSEEQQAMVTTLTSDGAGVSVVVGAAGTGKTHALAVARQAWQRNGYTVVGCALSARAANELQTSAEILSYTLDSLLGALEQTNSRRLKPHTVVVVDEAAMVGTRKLARLCDHAAQAQAKIVLVGDHHQLPAIEAGGAFAALTQRLGAIQLTNNQRQTDPVEREALTELRTGDPARAIELLDARGHVHRHTRREAAYGAMVDDWLPAVLNHENVIMLAPLRADVAELNQRARQALIARGLVDPYRLGAPLAMGDRILTLTNDYRLGLMNGERGFVTGVDPETGNVDVLFDRRRKVATIPAAYVEAGGVDYAYAMTVHKAQGLTCDRAYVLGDEHLHREAGYTALSRGRKENRLYTVTPEADHETHTGIDPDIIQEAIRHALEQETAKSLATDRQHQRGRSAEHDHGIDIGW